MMWNGLMLLQVAVEQQAAQDASGGILFSYSIYLAAFDLLERALRAPYVYDARGLSQ